MTRAWPSLRRHLRNFVIGCALACLGILLFERSITYQIARTTFSPEAAGLQGVTQGALVTGDGEKLVVWSALARPGQPTILYFHGNGEPLSYRAPRIAAFQAEGWGVYLVAWRGYSGSTGQPSEHANVHDAVHAYDHVREHGISTSGDIVVYGESMGASVAVRVALERPVRAVILEAPFTSMVATWRQFVPFLPVGLLLRDRYETIKVIGRLHAPLLVMHGTGDWLVWPWQGKALFDAAGGRKRFVALEGARHMNMYSFGAIYAVRRFQADVEAGLPLD